MLMVPRLLILRPRKVTCLHMDMESDTHTAATMCSDVVAKRQAERCLAMNMLRLGARCLVAKSTVIMHMIMHSLRCWIAARTKTMNKFGTNLHRRSRLRVHEPPECGSVVVLILVTTPLWGLPRGGRRQEALLQWRRNRPFG